MMMMMTGRVLLVCALCVLWCGVCCGGRAESTLDSPDTAPENDSQKEKVTVGGAGVDQNGKQKVTQVSAAPTGSELPVGVPRPSQAQQPEGGASVMPSVKMENQDQREEPKDEDEEEDEEEEEDEDDAKEEEAQVIISEQATEEEKKEKKKEEAKQKEQQEDGGEVEVLEEEDDRREEEEKENEEGETKKEAVPDTAEGTSAGGQEQPSLPSGAEGASNITNPNSTQTTGDDAPAADGAGTAEGKQNENKDANPKETPVTAAAMKTTTATTGDSDGSTAVSHTTSPLLLLLVVACAAAAVVAA
ncbi:mucin-associated surface protein (MASP), putative [Trypanosoma cruzi]|nr:mucin-associated surface protein (MASP), putative [Trypanosoma cruzi]